MAHQISIRKDGIAECAYAGKPAWHGLGVTVPEKMTPENALMLAHLDWEVERTPLYMQNADESYTQIRGKVATRRADNGLHLGVVGTDYQILQNYEQAQFISELIGGGAVVDAVGALWEGRRIFWTCKVPADYKLAGDKAEKYLLVMNSHDGSLAFRAFFTPVRVVCNNTLMAALGAKVNGKYRVDGFTIKHTCNINARVNEARELLGLADEYYRIMAEECDKLANKKMTADTFKGKFLPALIKTEGKKPDEITGQQTNLSDALIHNWIDSDIKDENAWRAYNAVTDYTTHTQIKEGRGKSDYAIRRLTNAVTGVGAKLAMDAFALAGSIK
jgi:phage/plasmid-like protein (TIGR03299 family)